MGISLILHADRGQIEQILINLCVNAQDAMPNGGTITTRIRNITLDQNSCSQYEKGVPGEYVLLSVADTGFGMKKASRKHIFQPFFTTKEIGKGTGPGIGICIPASRHSAPAQGPKCIEKPDGATDTILRAEDDALIRELSANTLRTAGYAVLTAKNREEAIRRLDEHPDQIAIAILNVIMPKLGGRAVYQHLRKHRPETRILFSSRYSKISLGTDLLQETKVELLSKPRPAPVDSRHPQLIKTRPNR